MPQEHHIPIRSSAFERIIVEQGKLVYEVHVRKPSTIISVKCFVGAQDFIMHFEDLPSEVREEVLSYL